MKPQRSSVSLMAVLLALAGISHAAARSPQPKSLKDGAYKKSVLQKIAQLIESKYVLAEEAKSYAAEFRKMVKTGAYAPLSDAREFADRVTADLQAITHDKHVSLRRIEASDIGEKAVSPLHHPVRFHRLSRKENKGFRKLEWINGHIGYIDLIRFNAIDQARDLVDGAMKFLEDADAIIIDIRQNGGGSGDYLSGFFLPYPSQQTSWHYREGNYTEEFWTSREMGGKPLVDVPLFVLIGPNTFSAAEIFAYDLQARKRAVLVGEPSKGGAHSIDLFKIDDQFEINISTSRAVNPVTGGNWEGTGVIPDVRAPADRVLETAIELAEKAGSEFARAREEKLRQVIDRMQVQLDLAERLFRDHEDAAAEAALDSLFRIGGEAGLIDYFFVFVLAYHYQTYSGKAEPIHLAILEKGVELFPNSVMAQRVLAAAYRDLGMNEQASHHFEMALALDPSNREIQRNLDKLRSVR